MLLLEFLSEISEIARGVGYTGCTPGNKQLQEQAKLGLVCWGGGKVSYIGRPFGVLCNIQEESFMPRAHIMIGSATRHSLSP